MKTHILGLGAAILLSPMAAQASTVTGTFDVTSAISERAGIVGVPVALWFQQALSAGSGLDYVFSEPGTFVADDDGATMIGSTVNASNDDLGFDFSFVYDRDFINPDYEFKDVWPDVEPHGNEDFFDFESGTVTGTGGFSGLSFTMVRAPADGQFVTQVGGGVLDGVIGANQHNTNFGISGWMTIDSVSVDMQQCNACTFDQSYYAGLVGVQADIIGDLTPAAVPLPAAGLLLLGAIGAFGGMARRRKS